MANDGYAPRKVWQVRQQLSTPRAAPWKLEQWHELMMRYSNGEPWMVWIESEDEFRDVMRGEKAWLTRAEAHLRAIDDFEF